MLFAYFSFRTHFTYDAKRAISAREMIVSSEFESGAICFRNVGVLGPIYTTVEKASGWS